MKKKKGQSRAERVRMRFENFSVPELEEVKAYHQERKVVTFEVEEFYDYYQARGWRYSDGTPIYDWKAALRSWVRQRKNDIWKLHKGQATAIANEAQEREQQQQERERHYQESKANAVSYEEYLRMKAQGLVGGVAGGHRSIRCRT